MAESLFDRRAKARAARKQLEDTIGSPVKGADMTPYGDAWRRDNQRINPDAKAYVDSLEPDKLKQLLAEMHQQQKRAGVNEWTADDINELQYVQEKVDNLAA